MVFSLSLPATAQRFFRAFLGDEAGPPPMSRITLAGAVEESTRSRYERLLKNKGENVVVGIEHSACGGCHMKLPAQVMTHCRAQGEIVTCPSCGRILYFSRDMILTAAE